MQGILKGLTHMWHDANIVADALCNFSADQSDAPAVDAVAVASMDAARRFARNARAGDRIPAY